MTSSSRNPVIRGNFSLSAGTGRGLGAGRTFRVMIWVGFGGLRAWVIIAENITLVIQSLICCVNISVKQIHSVCTNSNKSASIALYKPVNLSVRDRSPLVLWVSVLKVVVSEAPSLGGPGEYEQHHGPDNEEDQHAEHYAHCGYRIRVRSDNTRHLPIIPIWLLVSLSGW